MPRLLVSVRDVHEALLAAEAGAHFIDLKDPAAGALGGLPTRRISRIVQALRARYPGLPISATIGDVAVDLHEEILRRIARVALCGVDYVKVGIAATAHAGGAAGELLERLAHCGVPVVPVLMADGGVDGALVMAALREQAFPALMLDTADKRGGSLLQRVAPAALAAFVETVQAQGCAGERSGALDADLVRDLARRLAPRPHDRPRAALAL
jgi:uncharacterized protein (UPF0264 family)